MVLLAERDVGAADLLHDRLAGIGVLQRLELARQLGARLVVLVPGLDRAERLPSADIEADRPVPPAANAECSRPNSRLDKRPGSTTRS
jgi:hypothetical protein